MGQRERGFYQLDVFGTQPFSGNPLAVVVDAENLTTQQMKEISTWTNLSECTFLLPPTTPEADYRVRIFSLDHEIPFAGHPTLGTARAWLEAGNQPQHEGLIAQECEVGLVPVRYSGENLAFAAPPLMRSGPIDDELRAQLAAVLGIAAEDVDDAAWIDNGPGWVGILLGSAEETLSLRPDSSRSPESGNLHIGVIGPYPPGSEHAFEIRGFFTDISGQIREDPVTGSLNASAAQWMVDTKRAQPPYTVHQGTAIHRSGRISVQSDQTKLWVGGTTTVVIRGTIHA